MEIIQSDYIADKILYEPVNKIPLSKLINNKPPKGKTHVIIEERTGNILSFCSKEYKLIPNSVIYLPFENLLRQKNISFKKQVIIIEENKFYVDYIIKNRINSFSIPDILPKLSIWNSYDGTVKTQIKFGYYKLLCGNNLSRPRGCLINQSFKHSSDEEEHTNKDVSYLELFYQFINEIEHDIKCFEKLHKHKTNEKTMQILMSNLKLSKEAKKIAVQQLYKEAKGGFYYLNEKDKRTKHTGNEITLFTIYNAINYAIFHVNPKELPESKLKKDKNVLLEINKKYSHRN